MILRPYKRIKELEEKISRLEVDYLEYINLKIEKKQRMREEDRKLRGLHRPSVLCEGCKNLVMTKYGCPYSCKLDYKCEDRVESDGV